MTYRIYDVTVRARMTSATEDDPTLEASAAGATPVLEAVVINGVEVALSSMATSEKEAIRDALQQAVVDKLD